ncbi:MAG: ribosomal L7Ae/L30e/S12e/Gadd45 family protein [Butyricicoccaceae bacterium]
MATDPVLRMLGLARRAGKLAYGDELVREACFDHKTRCVFIAGDAGANAAKKAAFYADKANVPCVTLPHGKLELGSAIGKAGCAMCAVADIGMAAAAVNKLAEQDPAYAEVAQQLSEKNVKIQSRRGVKKHKDKAEKTEEAPVKTEKSAEEKPKRTNRKPSGEKRPFRKDGEYRPYRKNDGEKRPFRKDSESVRIARMTARSVRSARTANIVRIARTTERSARSARTANAARTVKAVPASRASTAASAASAIKRNFPRRSAHSNSKA